MRRKFVTNLGFLILLNVLVKPLYVFGIDRIVQIRVGAATYGSYFYLFNTALIFQIILDLGIESFIRREIARDHKLSGHFLPSILILKTFLGILYMGLCYILAQWMGMREVDIPLMLLILLNQFLASFILYMRANLGGLQLFKTESFISILDRTILILIVGYLLFFSGPSKYFNIKWFVLSQTFAYSVTLLLSFIIVLRKAGKIERFRINLLEFKSIFKLLKPYALLVLLMSIYYRVDSLLLVKLLPDGEIQSGIYAHAFRLLDFMSNYALLFPILLLPIFSKILFQKERIDHLLQLSVLLLLMPSLIIIIPTLFYRVEVFKLLYEEHINNSANVFAILTLSYLGMCISYTFGALLTANGNLRELNIMAGIAVLISIILNLLLIPRYKVIGAASANAMAQLFTIIFHIIIASRTFKLKSNFRMVLKLTLFLLTTFLVGFLVRSLNVPWFYGFCIIGLTGISIAFLTGLINLREAYFMVSKSKNP